MLIALAILLVAACASGLWVWLVWRKQPLRLEERRAFVHGLSAALVLVLLLLSLDQHGSSDGPRLLLIFLSIATGMLLFLKRQRQQSFPSVVLIAHVVLALAGLSWVVWKL